jgi:hypothetical protein
MQGYSTSIEVTSTPTVVFGYINDVPKWWLREVVGASTEFEGKSSNLNDEFILRHTDNHYSKHQLIAVIPNKKVVWMVTDSKLNWINGNKAEWTGTKMIFEIIADGEKTTLIFTHEGLVPQLECYEHCVHFWDRVIKDWIFSLITQGTNDQSYSAIIEVPLSPQEVFMHVNDVSNWWSKDFKGQSTKLNDEFVIEHPGAHYSKHQLTEVIPNQKVVWLVTESHLNWLEKNKDEWTNTKMIFEIIHKGDTTVLKFTHEGLVPELECYARCTKGWDMVIKEWLYKKMSV